MAPITRAPRIHHLLLLLALLASQQDRARAQQSALRKDAPSSDNKGAVESTDNADDADDDPAKAGRHALFNMIDVNGDYRLDLDEVHQYFASRGAAVSEGLWENEDKNGDGYIEIDEFIRGPNEEL